MPHLETSPPVNFFENHAKVIAQDLLTEFLPKKTKENRLKR